MSKNSSEILNPTIQERRLVFSGNEGKAPTEKIRHSNRPAKRRKNSPLRLILFLSVCSFLVVYYVWNKIAVNRLAEEVHLLEKQKQALVNGNAILSNKVESIKDSENLMKIATEKLGLVTRTMPPIPLDIDPERLQVYHQQ